MVVRISDKTQNYSKITKLLVKPYSIEVFIKKMKDLIEKGKTVIIASHDFVDIGYSRFITMKNGKLYEETAK